MFFKGSRYKDLPENTTINKKAQSVRSTTVRLRPDAPGSFQHTVNQAERLDLLAYKYYGDPAKWWLISDANPEFSVPTDLLNMYPVVQETFMLEPPDHENRWALLKNALENLRGIREVFTDALSEKKTLKVVYNAKEVDRKEIEKVVTDKDFIIKMISKEERFGQKIIIPPNQIV